MNLLCCRGALSSSCDTYVNADPTPEQLVEMTGPSPPEEIRRFGLVPRLALVSARELRQQRRASAAKMRIAYC